MLHINIDRLSKRLNTLGECGALAGGGVARLALSAEDKLGRDLVYSWMQDLELDIRIDQIGNVIGILPGKSDLPPVMMGSHIDTVRTGGLYDGNLGVLAGLEVIESIKEQNIDIDHPVAVGFFTNEEGARFAPDMMGSLAYVGDLDLEEALNTKDADGLSVRDCLNSIGYAGEYPVKHTIPKCFIELHIEQGPVLDIENIDIGVVTGVQGIS
ncbi:MAG: hydantoinase/carbamoylase family amidase, partial [Alphaproteobacteria bacterium]|nr:hydantoinase/carbamoylase family amidase [Alphaproteobacteria bacterium]